MSGSKEHKEIHRHLLLLRCTRRFRSHTAQWSTSFVSNLMTTLNHPEDKASALNKLSLPRQINKKMSQIIAKLQIYLVMKKDTSHNQQNPAPKVTLRQQRCNEVMTPLHSIQKASDCLNAPSRHYLREFRPSQIKEHKVAPFRVQ